MALPHHERRVEPSAQEPPNDELVVFEVTDSRSSEQSPANDMHVETTIPFMRSVDESMEDMRPTEAPRTRVEKYEIPEYEEFDFSAQPLPEGWEQFWGTRKEEPSPNIAYEMWKIYLDTERMKNQNQDGNMLKDSPQLEIPAHPTIFDSKATEINNELTHVKAHLEAFTKYINDPLTNPQLKEEYRRKVAGYTIQSQRLEGMLDALKNEGFVPLEKTATPDEIDTAIRLLTTYVTYRDDGGLISGLDRYEETLEMLTTIFRPFQLERDLKDVQERIKSLVGIRPVPEELFSLAQKQLAIEEELRKIGHTPQ